MVIDRNGAVHDRKGRYGEKFGATPQLRLNKEQKPNWKNCPCANCQDDCRCSNGENGSDEVCVCDRCECPCGCWNEEKPEFWTGKSGEKYSLVEYDLSQLPKKKEHPYWVARQRLIKINTWGYELEPREIAFVERFNAPIKRVDEWIEAIRRSPKGRINYDFPWRKTELDGDDQDYDLKSPKAEYEAARILIKTGVRKGKRRIMVDFMEQKVDNKLLNQLAKYGEMRANLGELDNLYVYSTHDNQETIVALVVDGRRQFYNFDHIPEKYRN